MKLSAFPALNQLLSQRRGARLKKADTKLVNMGKTVVKKARQMWQGLLKEAMSQPSMLTFVLLKNTMIVTYTILNNIYIQYLPGRKNLTLHIPSFFLHFNPFITLLKIRF